MNYTNVMLFFCFFPHLDFLHTSLTTKYLCSNNLYQQGCYLILVSLRFFKVQWNSDFSTELKGQSLILETGNTRLSIFDQVCHLPWGLNAVEETMCRNDKMAQCISLKHKSRTFMFRFIHQHFGTCLILLLTEPDCFIWDPTKWVHCCCWKLTLMQCVFSFRFLTLAARDCLLLLAWLRYATDGGEGSVITLNGTVSYLLFIFGQSRQRSNFSWESQIGSASLLPRPLVDISTSF